MTIEATIWQVLRRAYVSALTNGDGDQLSTPQVADLLDSWDARIEADLEIIMMAVQQSSDQMVGEVFGILRKREIAGDKEIQGVFDALKERHG